MAETAAVSSSSSPFHGASLPSLKGTDTNYPFTKDSILIRLPLIVKETAERNPELSSEEKNQITALANEIANNETIVPLLSPQPESLWETTYVTPYIGQHYLDIPWFFLENYVYKRILDIVRPHHPNLDPFLSQKMEALHMAGNAFLETVLPLLNEVSNGTDRSTSFRDILHRSLWGNRADLSMSGGKVHTIEHKRSSGNDTNNGSGAVIMHEEDLNSLLLWDDTKAIEDYLNTQPSSPDSPKEIMIILDNCGLELLSDLGLAYGLLTLKYCTKITLMSKTSPVFVSDALPVDIEAHLHWLETNTLSSSSSSSSWTCQRLASALRKFQQSGQLHIENHAFFTSPLPAWEMPNDLRQRLSTVTLAIIKGDANYRRLLGDRHWLPHQIPFATAISYYPCPAVALRTLKGACAVGISKDGEERAVKNNPIDWLVSGKYGVIHYKP